MKFTLLALSLTAGFSSGALIITLSFVDGTNTTFGALSSYRAGALVPTGLDGTSTGGALAGGNGIFADDAGGSNGQDGAWTQSSFSLVLPSAVAPAGQVFCGWENVTLSFSFEVTQGGLEFTDQLELPYDGAGAVDGFRIAGTASGTGAFASDGTPSTASGAVSFNTGAADATFEAALDAAENSPVTFNSSNAGTYSQDLDFGGSAAQPIGSIDNLDINLFTNATNENAQLTDFSFFGDAVFAPDGTHLPEPSAATFLGIAGLTFLTRRKRI